jgi:hypothetical protein
MVMGEPEARGPEGHERADRGNAAVREVDATTTGG